MGIVRCSNCPPTGKQPFEFTSAVPAARATCPTCQAPPRYLVDVEVIHYDPPTGFQGLGQHVAACNPKIGIGRPRNTMMTGEPSAVTCRACQQTDVWKQQAAKRGVPVVPPELDPIIEVPAPAGKDGG